MADLRDLEADRRLCETELPNISTAHYDSPSGICWSFANRSKEALAAALDEIERLKRNDRTGHTCNGCKTGILEKESMFVEEIGPEPRYWHPLCIVAKERDELKAEVERLRNERNNWEDRNGS